MTITKRPPKKIKHSMNSLQYT